MNKRNKWHPDEGIEDETTMDEAVHTEQGI